MDYVYLDNAATTPLDGRVLEAMLPWLRRPDGGVRGNPSSLHRAGAVASEAIEAARESVAAMIGAVPGEIVFTSGGTEADNLAVFGLAGAAPPEKRHAVISQIEHAAVREAGRYLEERGFTVTWLETDGFGRVDVSRLEAELRPDTAFVGVMWANNEVGTVQPVAEIAELCAARGVPFHTDAVQAAGRERIEVGSLPGVSTLALSAHKLGGPQGTGALYVGTGVELTSRTFGGGQERGLRSGTENVAGIVGFGAAARLATGEFTRRVHTERALRDRIIDGATQIPGVRLNGHPSRRLSGNVHLTVPGAESESLVLMLDALGFAVGKGSACSSSGHKASPVLEAMGQGADEAFSALRVSVGFENTAEEIDAFLEALGECVSRLREMAPRTLKANSPDMDLQTEKGA
ncbi:cysteine desulfurase family protein [Rubrobacter indicoceani]|uniref:cysteine desulfurase family protein n=1 Tax=Rubrobacter indicoceani TaxID=2051957 RepID=UPI000E5B1ABB|nr:cysteine desulfurase family protein [Rubrobacter indicoceani]